MISRKIIQPLSYTILIIAILYFSYTTAAELKIRMPDDFVSITDLDPSIMVTARYYGDFNFIGKRIDGYKANKCYLTKVAAEALVKAQADLKKQNLSLKMYDCYRPQKAVNHFVRWAKDLNDIKMKTEFYPTVSKKNLFRDGYIASKSGHSRGSTVDLALTSLNIPAKISFKDRHEDIHFVGPDQKKCDLPKDQRNHDNSVDMGTSWDCFSPLSHTMNPKIGEEQKKNRLLLKTTMEKYGFKNYSKEWWHFTLKNEPYPNTYFNFNVE